MFGTEESDSGPYWPAEDFLGKKWLLADVNTAAGQGGGQDRELILALSSPFPSWHWKHVRGRRRGEERAVALV